MFQNLDELTELPIFHYFSEISKIPRCSGNEREISDYIVRFAEKRNLNVIQDDSNLIIKKPATLGYEKAPIVIIQGHIDMVCEKNEGVVHDFKKDSLQLRIIGDMLYATETTLGADNGVAIAYMLALLDANDISHPSLEFVFTTEEETSMKGALTIEPKHLEGKIMINIDSEKEGKLTVSGAGGLQTIHTIPIDCQKTEENMVSYTMRLTGLKGGHSGTEINQERGNALKLLGRVLHNLASECSYQITDINGGMASNAIPREASTTIVLSEKETSVLKHVTRRWTELLKDELTSQDSEVSIQLEYNEATPPRMFTESTTWKTVASLMLLPNGIQSMSTEIEGLVESSINLGKVFTTDISVVMESDARSSVRSRKYAIVSQSEVVAKSLGTMFKTMSDYPEWPYNPHSYIRKVFENVYRKREGKDIKVTAVHAGIECGIFVDKIPGLDAISFGADQFEVHSPNEHVSISSMLRNWDYLRDVLQELA